MVTNIGGDVLLSKLGSRPAGLLLAGCIVTGLLGCGSPYGAAEPNANNVASMTSTVTPPVPGEIQSESIKAALKQVHVHIKVPSYFPFTVTSSYAMVTPVPSHPNLFQVSLYYLNTPSKTVITERVTNIQSATKVSGTTKKLRNGLNVIVRTPFDWYWTEQAVSYNLSVAGAAISGKVRAANISDKEMEQIVASMK